MSACMPVVDRESNLRPSSFAINKHALMQSFSTQFLKEAEARTITFLLVCLLATICTLDIVIAAYTLHGFNIGKGKVLLVYYIIHSVS